MGQIVSVHGFRRGTGKTTLATNLGVVLAQRGLRVGLVDTDERTPGIAAAFGEPEPEISLHDYLAHGMSIDKTAHPLPLDAPKGGGLWLVPFPIYAAEIKLLLERKYDVDLLYDGYNKLIEALELDVLLVDTVSGLDEETLLSIATSDVLIEVLRPNQRDYYGTSVTIDVAKKLDITELTIVMNLVPSSLDWDTLTDEVEETYNCPVLAVVPHTEDVDDGVYALTHPDAALTALYRTMAQALSDS